MPLTTVQPEWRDGMWKVRIRKPDGSRPWVPLRGIPRDRVDDAVSAATFAREAARKGTPLERGETLGEYAKRWLETVATQSTRKTYRLALAHAMPTMGHLPIVGIQREHLEDFVTLLDERVAGGELAPKTASNIWGVLRKLFADAHAHKARVFRVRADNPAQTVRAPERGVERLAQWLYPSELLQLLQCEKVPLLWRRIYAIAAYSGVRVSELAALQWEDVDLERRVIVVHQSEIRNGPDRGQVAPTKSRRGRRYTIEQALVPLLQQLRRELAGRLRPERRGERVITVPKIGHLAERFRQYLTWAHVGRRALHEATATSRRITHHDLRATYLTWQALRGDDLGAVQARAGHAEFATTAGYLREARALMGSEVGALFPELPRCLFGTPLAPLDGDDGGGSRANVADSGSAPGNSSPTSGAKFSAESVDPRGQRANAGPIETALARAIHAATDAGQWQLVAELARIVDRRLGREEEPASERTLRVLQGGRG